MKWLTLSPFQEQDSPDSLFSFAIDISEDEGEEASSSRAVGITSAEVRAKLEELSALLHQDTAQLVDDSDPAKVLFKTLRGQIPVDAEEILFQAAHLESRQLQYQRATQRLADRAAHAQLSEEMMKAKLLADEKHKNIGILKSSGDALKHKISDLSAKREALWQNSSKWKTPCPKPDKKKANCWSQSSFLSKSVTSKPARLCR